MISASTPESQSWYRPANQKPIVPIRKPPISPSSVLLGERLGAILWLPNMRPVA